MIGAILMGMNVTEAGSFYYHYPNERWPLKVLVALLLGLSVSTECSVISICWHYLIDARNDDVKVMIAPPAQNYVFVSPVFSAIFAQLFFGYRCWRFLNKGRLVGIGLLLLILTPFIIGLTN
ncbi:hypothetical protein BT69DRAFT_777719 [Atractiella rhizophila]|nr:hypothetical protein BT69DRAFT_777719 [Atractiella rhizophila]